LGKDMLAGSGLHGGRGARGPRGEGGKGEEGEMVLDGDTEEVPVGPEEVACQHQHHLHVSIPGPRGERQPI